MIRSQRPLVAMCTLLLACGALSLLPAHSAPTKRAALLRFAVVGDIMTHGVQVRSAYDASCRCHRFRPVFEEVKPLLSKADITIGNLETTLPGPKAGYSRAHSLVFGSPDTLADALKWAGFDLMITANNHICDKGFKGLSRTLRVLDRHQLKHFGAYHSRRAYRTRRFLVLRQKGWRIALLSYTTHANGCMRQKERINLLYWPQVRRDVKRAKRRGFDAVIVHYHFGPEYVRVPDKIQRGAVRTALRAGADIVLGGHSHVIQPIQVQPRRRGKGNTLVAYSLGNFVSNIRRRYTDGGIILYFSLRKRHKRTVVSNVQVEPVWVYKRPNPKRPDAPFFHILPIRKYKQGKGKWKLQPKDKREMLLFERDTHQQLKNGMQQARRYAP